VFTRNRAFSGALFAGRVFMGEDMIDLDAMHWQFATPAVVCDCGGGGGGGEGGGFSATYGFSGTLAGSRTGIDEKGSATICTYDTPLGQFSTISPGFGRACPPTAPAPRGGRWSDGR
jgi:hypothetical protein